MQTTSLQSPAQATESAMRITDLIVHSIAIADLPLPNLRAEEIAELRTMIECWKPVLTP